PKEGVPSARGGIALTDNRPASSDSLSCARGSAQRPEVDYREQRIKTGGRVAEAGCKAEKRILALGGVVAGIACVWCWVNRSGRRRKRKADEHERNEKERAQRRAVY